MKKIIAPILSLLLLFAGCNANKEGMSSSTDAASSMTQATSVESTTLNGESAESATPEDSAPPEGHTHSYTAVVTERTCTTKGYTTYTCACGNTYTADEKKPLGHINKTIPGTSSTCKNTGLTDGIICSVCGETVVEQTVIPVKGHTYTATVTKPTCTERGYTTYVCTCGDRYTADDVNALGHSWLPATTMAPKTCVTCGKTEGEKLPPEPDTPDTPDTPTPPSTTYSTLSVHYIDVGQGDSILIRVDNCDILIDAGKPDKGTVVSNYLKALNVDDIELMINTHYDDDHYGGLTTVLKDYVVEDIWVTGYSKSNTSITTFKNAIANEGLDLETPAVGTVFTYQQLTLTVLYNGAGASSSNDSSIVVKLQYGDFSFLFTGDIGTKAESKLVETKVDLSCDVLKVGHHGSRTSSTANFLKATGAKYGVICVGTGNSYGHPTDDALSRLSSANISVYRTDKNGHVVFSTDGETLTLPGSGGSVQKSVAARKAQLTTHSSLKRAYKNIPWSVLPPKGFSFS